jgi:hypothetical protein
MTQRMRRDSGKIGFQDSFRPDILHSLKMAVPAIAWENEIRPFGLAYSLEKRDSRCAEWASRFARLAVFQYEHPFVHFDF